jgi:hypothetical protein
MNHAHGAEEWNKSKVSLQARVVRLKSGDQAGSLKLLLKVVFTIKFTISILEPPVQSINYCV